MKMRVSLLALVGGGLLCGAAGHGDAADFGTGEGLVDPNAALVGAVMTQGMTMANQCDVDISGAIALAGNAGGLGSDAAGMGVASDSSSSWDVLKSAVALFPDTCNKHQVNKFELALSDFKTCSSFDLERIMETVADSLLGSLIECILAVAPIADDFIAAMEADDNVSGGDFEIPDLCLESFLGQNPLGDMLRTYALYPDRVLPCFSDLSESIPSCTLQRWPIPLIGPLLKKVTCLLGSATPIIEEVVSMDLQTMHGCLPSDISPSQCDAILDSCMERGSSVFSSPKPLLGAPLSDLAKRVANEQGMDDVVTGYEAYVQQCIPNVWKGWSYANGQYDAPESDGDDNDNPPLLGSSSSQVPSNGEGSTGASFMAGVALGIIVSAAAASVFIIYRQRQQQNEHQPIGTRSDNIELI